MSNLLMQIAGMMARRVSGWLRAGMNLETSFESSDGTDTSPVGLNSLALTNTAIVTGITGLALDTLTTGHACNTAITSDLKTTAGTLDFLIKRKSLAQDFYISFSTSGGTTDEIFVNMRKENVSATVSNNVTLGVTDGGVGKIIYYTTLDQLNVIDQYYRVTVTADGVAHKVYIDAVLQAIILKAADDAAYRGVWSGDARLSSINSFTVGGINRATVIVNNGDHVLEFVRVYDYAKTQTQITEEQAIIGGEK